MSPAWLHPQPRPSGWWTLYPRRTGSAESRRSGLQTASVSETLQSDHGESEQFVAQSPVVGAGLEPIGPETVSGGLAVGSDAPDSAVAAVADSEPRYAVAELQSAAVVVVAATGVSGSAAAGASASHSAPVSAAAVGGCLLAVGESPETPVPVEEVAAVSVAELCFPVAVLVSAGPAAVDEPEVVAEGARLQVERLR